MKERERKEKGGHVNSCVFRQLITLQTKRYQLKYYNKVLVGGRFAAFETGMLKQKFLINAEK